MKFTEEEVEQLKKIWKNQSSCHIDENAVLVSTNQGFGRRSLFKLDDGRIRKSWCIPMDVDVDDGSVGSYNTGEKFYSNFEEYLKQR